MPTLRFDQVRRWFGEEPRIEALRGVDLTINQGDFIAIEGPSGSGKSTLLNQLALVDRPSAGAYTIDGEAVDRLSERARARLRSDLFGFVFQSFHLMRHRTALENVEVGLLYRGLTRSRRRVLAQKALESVGLAHRSSISARKLSGGEQQRVAIARATIGNAPVLVADEPTGNLDSGSGDGIVAKMRSLNAEGTTIVLVTHDPGVAANAGRRVQLRDGTAIDTTGEVESEPASQAPRAGATEVPGRPSTLRFSDLIRESWHALRGRPGRSSVLIAAVGIAVSLVVVTLGLSQSASGQVSDSFDIQRNREVTATVPTVQAVGRDGTVTASSGVPSDIEARLHNINGVTAAGVLEAHNSTAVLNPGQPAAGNLAVAGISPDLLASVGATVKWAPGHVAALGRHEVLVGHLVAEQIQLGPLALDPVVEISGVTYGVAGVIVAAERAPQLSADIAVDWTLAGDISQLSSSAIYATTVSGAAQQVAAQVPVAIDAIHADTIEVQAPPDPTSLRAAIQSDVRTALLALTIVASLASILSVANAMLLSVLERIGEFGLRRAIGARPTHILAQTGVEAAMAGLFGGIAGLGAGIAVILGVTVANRWQPTLDFRLIPLAVIGGIVVGVLGGLPASLRASRIQPADALRR